MATYTTNDLIKSVRVRGMFPDASKGSLSPENILMVATEEMRSKIIPMIMSAREKYYETFIDYPVVANQAIYDIPKRAVGSLASVVQFIINQAVTNLTPLEVTSVQTTNTGRYPKGFYFENDKIVLYPTPNETQGTLRVRYFQRTSALVQTCDSAQIREVDQANRTVTVSSYPSNWSGANVIDFISNQPPYTPYSIDQTIDNIADGNIITLVGALPLNREGKLAVSVGDWLAPAGYTPIPELMDDFFPILIQATLVRLLAAVGDEKSLQVAMIDLKDYTATALKMITPRDQLGLKKVRSDWRNW